MEERFSEAWFQDGCLSANMMRVEIPKSRPWAYSWTCLACTLLHCLLIRTRREERRGVRGKIKLTPPKSQCGTSGTAAVSELRKNVTNDAIQRLAEVKGEVCIIWEANAVHFASGQNIRSFKHSDLAMSLLGKAGCSQPVRNAVDCQPQFPHVALCCAQTLLMLFETPARKHTEPEPCMGTKACC